MAIDYIFQNLRGLKTVRPDNYKFPVAEGIHKKLLLRLHEKMRWPYFLEKKTLILYSEDDAMWLKLVSNDIEKFANSLD